MNNKIQNMINISFKKNRIVLFKKNHNQMNDI